MGSNKDVNEVFSKFKDDKNKSYYILIQWDTSDDDKYLELTLTDASNSWSVTSTKANLEKKSNLKAFSLEKIKQEINQIFKYNSSSKSDYIINISSDDSLLTQKLVVKKKLDDDMNIELTRLELTIVDDPSVKNVLIFNYCLNCIDKLENKLECTEHENKRLSDERHEALQEYSRCVDEKNKIETDLYGKFILILNEKKNKIKELKEEANMSRNNEQADNSNEIEDDGNQLIKIGKKSTKSKTTIRDNDDFEVPAVVPKESRADSDANDSLCLDLNQKEEKSTKISLTERRKLRRKASDQNLKTITEDNRTTVTESEENDTDDRRRSKRNSSNMKNSYSTGNISNSQNRTLNVDDLIDRI